MMMIDPSGSMRTPAMSSLAFRAALTARVMSVCLNFPIRFNLLVEFEDDCDICGHHWAPHLTVVRSTFRCVHSPMQLNGRGRRQLAGSQGAHRAGQVRAYEGVAWSCRIREEDALLLLLSKIPQNPSCDDGV